MKTQRFKLSSIIALAALVSLVCVSSVRADIIPNGGELRDATRATGWRVSWTSSAIQEVSFVGRPPTGVGVLNKGTMTVKLTLNDLNPVDLVFDEIAPATANAFGLRMTLNEEITNNSGFNWTGYAFHAIPNTPLAVPAGADPNVDAVHPAASNPPFSQGSHPAPPHFNADGFNFSPLGVSFSDGHVSGNPSMLLVLGGGVVQNGQTWNPRGLGPHA
jgi:hypothetical protein